MYLGIYAFLIHVWDYGIKVFKAFSVDSISLRYAVAPPFSSLILVIWDFSLSPGYFG